MEPKMNFYYPGDQEVDDSSDEIESADVAPTFHKPKTRKEYFLAKFLSKLNGLSSVQFNALPNLETNKDDLQYAWLVRKYVSRRPFEFNEKDNAYVLSIEPVELAVEYGIDARSIMEFPEKNSRIMDSTYYEVIIDNTYSCNVSFGVEDAVPCGPYEIRPIRATDRFRITSETEPTHIPVVDVYIHYVIYKQPKSTLEYYIAKAAGYPLLNTDNPPEPKTAEEIYWAYVCKESGGGGSGDVVPGAKDLDGNS